MKYLVIYERSATGWGAYLPDLPGLGVAASSLDEVKKLIREGIDFHLEGMKIHGDPMRLAERVNAARQKLRGELAASS